MWLQNFHALARETQRNKTPFAPNNICRGYYFQNKKTINMAANAGNQRIIPLEEGWNDEIKAKVRRLHHIAGSCFVLGRIFIVCVARS